MILLGVSVYIIGIIISLLSIRYSLKEFSTEEDEIATRTIITFIPILNIGFGIGLFWLDYSSKHNVEASEIITKIMKKVLFVEDKKEDI